MSWDGSVYTTILAFDNCEEWRYFTRSRSLRGVTLLEEDTKLNTLVPDVWLIPLLMDHWGRAKNGCPTSTFLNLQIMGGSQEDKFSQAKAFIGTRGFSFSLQTNQPEESFLRSDDALSHLVHIGLLPPAVQIKAGCSRHGGGGMKGEEKVDEAGGEEKDEDEGKGEGKEEAVEEKGKEKSIKGKDNNEKKKKDTRVEGDEKKLDL
ncbi:uncharacterized protein LACBIDRAFT_330865 [Laccaria bicolor S238N-H82]|uniref:Predicted protein n=1 Tax=Laccaria bicolor (strain S238N-H82 / ATCC MYA-4686) TaxID=486041 RepID=B0DN04_LACBS|nr:uncharacterized protein LACBIDRAFT_330865 [Laccaria bicolor S238N-H82]EDR04064.1 predicted protein [Laccaria bicolor S238N-H82]|eukprot:XP_001885319.1 predicted protein [Laccaria bicolor S238N-H82]